MTTYQYQKNPFLDRRPYVYAIMWTEHNIAYIGVRYAKGCAPEDFWTSYFTSSKHVEKFREEHGEPDHIEILEEFLTADEAMNAECEIISTFELHTSSAFLNKCCPGSGLQFDPALKRANGLKGNRNRARKFEYNGLLLTVPEWAERVGMIATQISVRLNQGWSFHDAITRPVRPRRKSVYRDKAK